MHVLVLIRSLLKQGFASAEQKKQVAEGLKALKAEEAEAVQEDAEEVAKLPEEAPAAAPAADDGDKEQEELEKGIKNLVTTSTKAAAKEAVDAMKAEVKEWLESQKEAIKKKSGIYNPEVQEKRKKLNTYIRDLHGALLSNDFGRVKELTTDDTGSPYGGHVVDSELSAEIRHLATEYGVARREMATLQLSKNSYRANELVTDVTVFWVDEGAAIKSTQVVLDQETLELKKLAAIVTLTRELLQDQEIDLFAFIGTRVAEKFAQAEDEMAFIGDGTSAYGGFTGIFNVFRRASLTPLAGVSASKNDPLLVTLIRLPTGHDGGWVGDEGRGHDCTDPARLSGAGQGDQGDRARVARVAEHGAQGSALG